MPGEDWVHKARLFAQEHLAPAAAGIDREQAIPEPLYHLAAREGFFGLTTPPEYGGHLADARTIAGVITTISEASLAFSTGLGVHLSVAAAPIAAWGSPAQKEAWLPRMAKGEWLGAFALTEASGGSDAQSLTTRYAREGDGFRLDGSKTFITNGGLAEVVLTFATSDPSKGAHGISCFLVRKGTRGFQVARHLDKLGLRGSETTELHFEDCPVACDALLGNEGEGFKIAMSALEGGRIGIAASSLGVARAALSEITRFAAASPEGLGRSVLAQSYVEVEAASALVERAARLKDEGEPFGMAASAAKLYASQTAFRIASRAVELGGPRAAVEGAAAERLFRDARVLSIVEGTTEIQEMILGRRLLSQP